MVISEKRHKELYSAISDPIMELRIISNSGLSIEAMDRKLSDLESEIYNRIRKALDLHKAAD